MAEKTIEISATEVMAQCEEFKISSILSLSSSFQNEGVDMCMQRSWLI